MDKLPSHFCFRACQGLNLCISFRNKNIIYGIPFVQNVINNKSY